MGRILLLAALCATRALAQAPAPDADAKPLPPIRGLLLDVENNERFAESKKRDYTYHVHTVQTELDGNGNVKKTTSTDAESVTIDGVRVDRTVARNGKPLTEEETKKESERIDKEVAKAKEHREKREQRGEDTDARGDEVVTAERILELGTFSNPRRVEFNGRPAIAADYAGDPHAKTRNPAEGVFRDLVGTVWFDEQDRVLVHAEGHFLNDFKIGAGLVADVKKNSSFEVSFTKVNGEAWIVTKITAQGKIRILLFGGFNGSFSLTTSDYRKFHATSTISATGTEVSPAGESGSDPPAAPKP